MSDPVPLIPEEQAAEQLRVEARGMTLADLIDNTEVVLDTTRDRGIHQTFKFLKFQAKPFTGVKALQCYAEVMSQDGSKSYSVQMAFYDVAPGTKPKYNVNPVRVRCSCKGFYYYFGYWCFQQNSLLGPKPRPYVRKTLDRPEVNPGHLSGCCKHLVAMSRFLTDAGELA